MKKIGTTRQKKKVDPQKAANNLADQLNALYQAQQQASMNQTVQQGQAMTGLAQAIDPNALYQASGSAPLTSWGGTSSPNQLLPNQQGNWYAGGGAGGGGGAGQSTWTIPNQPYPGFNPLEFITEQQKDELASMLLKKVLKALSDDDKEMLRKLLKGKL